MTDNQTPSDAPAGQDDDGELVARIWKREPYADEPDGEWVLEISGEVNGCAFVARHTEPLTTALEDVAGLPSLYASLARMKEEAE